MAVHIRLTRTGKPKNPQYRIVAIDSRASRDGRPLEVIGYYSPTQGREKVEIKSERLKYWLGCGALPTDTVKRLLKKSKVASQKAA